MLLSDRDILAEIDEGRIGLEPWDPGMVQPSSIDVRLDRFFRVFENHRYPHIDPSEEQAELTRAVEPEAGEPFILHPGEFALGSIYEVVTQKPELHGPPRYFTPDWDASRASVERLSALAPEIVVTGHGDALKGPLMRAALGRLAREFDAVAPPKSGVYVERPERAEDGSVYHRRA